MTLPPCIAPPSCRVECTACGTYTDIAFLSNEAVIQEAQEWGWDTDRGLCEGCVRDDLARNPPSRLDLYESQW